MYIVHVQPQKVITESDYFIKMIDMCVANRNEEIQKVESQCVLEEKPDEWALIQQMNDQDYLMRTVFPVLYQGMRIVDIERPGAPLEFLALYLLKN